MTTEQRKAFLEEAKANAFVGYVINPKFQEHLSVDTIDAMFALLEKEIDKDTVEFDFKIDVDDVPYYNDYFRLFYSPYLVISFTLGGFKPTLTWRD